MAKKILFVGMSSSPHLAKWIELIADQGWELYLFPVHSSLPSYIHNLLRNIEIYSPFSQLPMQKYINQVLTKPFFNKNRYVKNKVTFNVAYNVPNFNIFTRILQRVKPQPLGESSVTPNILHGPKMLKKFIERVKPDLIHSMEFQHAGYLTLRTKELFGEKPFPKWLATNWGSDIYYYKRFPDHRKQITRLLQQVDFYSCECHRDLKIAQELGLKGMAMPIFPNTGGFDLSVIKPLREKYKPSSRRVIMVKGYQHFAGRALTALEALEKCAPLLRGYTVVVFCASTNEVGLRTQALKTKYGIESLILPLVDHSTIMKYFASSRVYLGVSISDAISTSMVEAMAMGAFPIQTNTACCEEWIQDGKTGFEIPPDDVDEIVRKLKIALSDDELVDSAAGKNWKVVSERLDKKVLQQKEIDFYQRIFKEGPCSEELEEMHSKMLAAS